MTFPCELGCRSDLAPGQRAENHTHATAEEFAAVLCEEFRRVNGPRRPGDPCGRDLDCLPYPLKLSELGQLRFGEASPVALHCAQGACEEGARIPSDLGEPCAGTGTGSVTESDACESGICYDNTLGPFCSMPCRDHADCPGVAYGCVIVGGIGPGYEYTNSVCEAPSPPAGGAGGEAGGAGASGSGAGGERP